MCCHIDSGRQSIVEIFLVLLQNVIFNILWIHDHDDYIFDRGVTYYEENSVANPIYSYAKTRDQILERITNQS